MPDPDDNSPEPQRAAPNIGRDAIDARGSQGLIAESSGSIAQNYGTQIFVAAAESERVIPACPQPLAGQLIGRDEIVRELIGRLTGAAEVVAICAVRGLPGVGKSDLLRAVGSDARTTAHFDGGVLLAELGPTPDLSQWLRRWITALGHAPPRSDDPATLAGALRAALAPRRALLLLDDVWAESLHAAMTLRDCGSPDCRALASSRSQQVAQDVARGAPPLRLDVLAAAPAVELLRRSARAGGVDVVARDAAGAGALAAALGGLPLALKLAGGWLRANYRNPRHRAQPCTALLATWRTKLGELRGYEYRPQAEPRTENREPAATSDGQLSLDAIIGLSYAALPDDATRTAAAALAAFGATPLDFDWEAMAAVWGVSNAAQKRPSRLRRWLGQIVGRNLNRSINLEVAGTWENAIVVSGLLDYDAETARYSLHQTVEAFLAARADPSAYERHATHYAALMLRHGEQTLPIID